MENLFFLLVPSYELARVQLKLRFNSRRENNIKITFEFTHLTKGEASEWRIEGKKKGKKKRKKNESLLSHAKKLNNGKTDLSTEQIHSLPSL